MKIWQDQSSFIVSINEKLIPAAFYIFLCFEGFSLVYLGYSVQTLSQALGLPW